MVWFNHAFFTTRFYIVSLFYSLVKKFLMFFFLQPQKYLLINLTFQKFRIWPHIIYFMHVHLLSIFIHQMSIYCLCMSIFCPCMSMHSPWMSMHVHSLSKYVHQLSKCVHLIHCHLAQYGWTLFHHNYPQMWQRNSSRLMMTVNIWQNSCRMPAPTSEVSCPCRSSFCEFSLYIMSIRVWR